MYTDEQIEQNEQQMLDTGESTRYRYYRLVESEVINEVSRTVKRNHGTLQKKVPVKQPKKEYYSEESILRFDLESHAKLLPHMNGNKTIVNNYLMRFWGPTFDPKCGGIVTYTYIILLSYCWDKDYTWISLDTLAKQLTCSRPTVRKYMEILEKAGFIIRFWREQEDDGRMNGTILVKVRQTLPLISRTQYNELPKSIRKEHDRFLRKIKRESKLEFDLSHNYHEVYEQLRNEVISVKNPTGVLKEEIEQLNEYDEEFKRAKKKMSVAEETAWSNVLAVIAQHISKPSFDTWFSKSVAYTDDDDRWLITLPNQFACEWVESRYSSMIIKVIKEQNLRCTNLQFDIYDEE